MILFPDDAKIWQVSNLNGVNERDFVVHFDTEADIDGSPDAKYVVRNVNVIRRINQVMHFRLFRPHGDEIPVLVRATHPDAEAEATFTVSLS